ncbi:TAXI family TRAP transporter solute-binding subunit [Natribaculum luteum]|uniref:TAXI family TRAP transporter solute-binding subunit n=1 Tax=Natribaculum luteum TaxID=1586232 RepID=A0ABD5P6E6_9EURY
MKGIGAAGVISLAGCLGSDDTITVTIGATSQNSSSQAAAQALARGLNEHSDTVRVDPQVTSGWTANLQEYDGGNIPAMAVDNNSLSKAMNEEGPFADNPVDELPMQGFVFTQLQIYWVATEDSGIESTADLAEGGYTIYPIQPGFGTRLLTEEVIQRAGLWEDNEIYNGDTTDVPGTVEEGNVDALCVYGANGVDLSGWVQEVDARADGLRAIEVDENFEQAIDDTPGALKQTFEPYGWNQDVTGITNEVTSWALAAQWAFGPDIPAEATKEIARVASEHHDTLRESDPTTLDHSDPETMTAAVMEGLEVHPGVADFFDEEGVWDDAWTRGEAE